MKAVFIDEFNFDDLLVTQVAKPQAKDDEVLISVQAAGLNFVDLLYSSGKHQNNRSLITPPFILVIEFSGVVLKSPPSSQFKIGDRVFGSALGSFAELIAVKEESLQFVPENLTFEDAAGLAATAPVSYGALINRGGLKMGEIILVHAAAGGLGLMAVQMAKATGAHVIATASTEEKLAVARQFGADQCINYSSESWWEKVLEYTNGEGVDVVFDPVGLVDKSLKCLKHKGRVLVVGFAGTEGQIERIAMNRVLLKQAIIIGYRYGESGRRWPDELTSIWKGVNKMLEKGLVKPTVYERRFRGLESIPRAMNDLAARKTWGKVVISMEITAEVLERSMI